MSDRPPDIPGRIFLFHIRSYNAMDHMLPLVGEFLARGQRVRLIFARGFRNKSDERVVALSDSPLLSISQVKIADELRRKFLFSKRSSKWIPDRFRTMIYAVGRGSRNLQGVVCVIYDWGGVSRPDFEEAKMLGLPVVAVPHGFNIFSGDDFNSGLVRDKEAGQVPNFGNRGRFDLYIVNHRLEQELLVLWGMPEDRLKVLGSARFSYESISRNIRAAKASPTAGVWGSGRRVLFFLPHWSYRVNRKVVLGFLKEVAHTSGVSLVVRAHTRKGEGGLSPEELHQLCSSGRAVFYDSSTPSSTLIEESDLVLSFGTSMLVEALASGKAFYHLPFMHENETIFDSLPAPFILSDYETAIAAIKKLDSNASAGLPGDTFKNWFERHVYGDLPVHNVAYSYFMEISALTARSPGTKS